MHRSELSVLNSEALICFFLNEEELNFA